MNLKWTLFLLLGLILSVPFLMRGGRSDQSADDVLIVISPHTEAMRHEFSHGFAKWYFEKTGRRAMIDWRVIGGTNEIIYYINSGYLNAFRYHWENQLGEKWTLNVQEAFSNGDIELGDDPSQDTLEMKARRTFLNSSVGVDMDLIFGGGVTDYISQAKAGHLVDSGIFELHPEWFGGEYGIPQYFSGDTLWDSNHLWIGAALNMFGIAYNTDALERAGFDRHPTRWDDLGDMRLDGEVALSDPTKSGAVAKAYEMIIQSKIHETRNEFGLGEFNDLFDPIEKHAIEIGWNKALTLLQHMCANTREFMAAAGQPVISVSSGNQAVCTSVAFYARFQQQTNRLRGGKPRLEYTMPERGTSISADPIAMLRGAKNPELARDFIEYVLSISGQQVISQRVGTPGGPERYPLGRPPIRPELYQDAYRPFSANPTLKPYSDNLGIEYHSEWTLPVFDAMRFIFKVAFIDVHHELKHAWSAIIKAKKMGRDEAAQAALAVFSDLSLISYQEALGTISQSVKSRNPIDSVRLADTLSDHFKHQYLKAKAIAEGKRR